MIEWDPRIRATLIGGDGHYNPFLTLELDEKAEGQQQPLILDQIWPSPAKVNEIISRKYA
jgi:hypothetical protein